VSGSTSAAGSHTLWRVAFSIGAILFGIDATWSTFVTGAVIVLAVSPDQLINFTACATPNAAYGD
jgi:ribose/xylose/arabinose/galactoside ABC-type transport system permease subunit